MGLFWELFQECQIGNAQAAGDAAVALEGRVERIEILLSQMMEKLDEYADKVDELESETDESAD